MKKKILVWETLATVSGGQKMTLAVMDYLSDTYDFVCLLPEEGRMSAELDLRGIPYIIIGDQSLPKGIKGKSVIFRYAAMSARCIWRSLKAIRKYKPDVLYAPGPAALPWSAVCGSLARKPVVWHLHHIFQDGMTAKLLNICSKWKSVRRVIAISGAVGSQLKTEKGAAKVYVAYNPIDADKYSSGDGAGVTAELENTYGVSFADSIVLTHVALIQRLKKQDVTLRAIKHLCDKGYNTIGIFPGEVREDDYMAELDALASDLGIKDCVIFCGRRSDIPDILAMTDVALVPSHEGFSLAAQEAAAAGVPVVATDVGGVAEFVSLTGAGETFTDDDPGSAAEKIIAVLENRELYADHGRSYSVNWSESKYRENLHTVFDEALRK